MGNLFQLLIFCTIGVILIWFGYALLFSSFRKKTARPPKTVRHPGTARQKSRRDRKRKGGSEASVETGKPGDTHICPICTAKLQKGERIKSAAFPGLPGQGRLMHIAGCAYCLDGSRRRTCPVCGAELAVSQILVARIFDKPGRSHVHVLGCSHCREALAGTVKPAAAVRAGPP